MYHIECFIFQLVIRLTSMVDLPDYALYDSTLKRKCFTCQKFYEILEYI